MRALDGGNLVNGYSASKEPDPLRTALEYYNGPGPNAELPFAIAYLSAASAHKHRSCVAPLIDWGWVVVGDRGAPEGADDDAFIEVSRTYAVPTVTNDKVVDRMVLSAQAGDNDEYATDVQLVSAARIGYTFVGGAFKPDDPDWRSIAEAFATAHSDWQVLPHACFARWQAARVAAAQQRRQADGGAALARWRGLNPGSKPHLTVQRRLMRDLECSARGLAEWVAAAVQKPFCTTRPAAEIHPVTGKKQHPKSLAMRFITGHPGTLTPQELSAINDDFSAWGWRVAPVFDASLRTVDLRPPVLAIAPDTIATCVLGPMLRTRARDYAVAKKEAAAWRARAGN
jgi:hypothetical protein